MSLRLISELSYKFICYEKEWSELVDGVPLVEVLLVEEANFDVNGTLVGAEGVGCGCSVSGLDEFGRDTWCMTRCWGGVEVEGQGVLHRY